MAVTAYVGRPGSGKSYGVVEHAIIPACYIGRRVITNIPVYVDKLKDKYPLSDVITRDIAWFDNDENLLTLDSGALIIIDEAWRLFPAGQKLTSVSEARKQFFAMHRHRVGDNGLTQDIIIVVQCLTKIAAWARADIDKTFVATKLDGVGMDNKFRVDIYQGGVKGPRYPTPDLGYAVQAYKPEVYQFYQSHTMGQGGAGLEIKADKRATILSHPVVKFGVPLGVFSIFLFGWSVVTFFTAHNSKNVKKVADKPPIESLGQVLPQPEVTPTKPVQAEPVKAADKQVLVETKPVVPESVKWRISGVVYYDGRMHVYIESGKRHRQVPNELCRSEEGELVCVVGGEAVTKFSGPAERRDLVSVADLNPLGESAEVTKK